MANVLATLASHRVVTYVVVSLSMLIGTVWRAVERNSNFYSIAVDLSRNSGSVLVLANFGVVLSLLLGRIFQQVFFGSLRASELERLYDRVWFFLTESLLAWTIFRDELDTSFGIMFGFLLFAKCFHWLLADRIEWMDQVPHPGPNWVFHIRANALFIVLWLIDITMLALAIESVIYRMSGVILFASEYAILLATLFNCIHKYLIVCYDIRRAARLGGDAAPPWEDKSMYMFYVDLITDFLKLLTYLVFFITVLMNYGLPLNIVRDVFLTARSFYGRVRDLMRYRAATRNMDQRYPDATAEELTAMNDRTCIICREEMISRGATAPTNPLHAETTQPAADPATPAAAPAPAAPTVGPNDTPKKLPCGHIFHFHCLRSWLERQQSCPTCRRTVLEQPRPANGTAAAAPNPPGVAAAAPQPGAVPQPPQAQQPAQRAGAAAAVGAHIQNMNAQLAQLHNLNQNIADTLHRLQRQQNNLVPNQLQYQMPGLVWGGVPPAAAAAAAPLDGQPAPVANAPAPQTPVTDGVAEVAARLEALRRARQQQREVASPTPQNAPEQEARTPPVPGAPSARPEMPRADTTPAVVGPDAELSPTASTLASAPREHGSTEPVLQEEKTARMVAAEAAARRLQALKGPPTHAPQSVVTPGPSMSAERSANLLQPEKSIVARSEGSQPTPITQDLRDRVAEARRRLEQVTLSTPKAGSGQSPHFNSRPALGPQYGLPPTRSSAFGVPAVVPLYDPSHAHIPGSPLLSFQQVVSPNYVGVPQANYIRAPFPNARSFATEVTTPRRFAFGSSPLDRTGSSTTPLGDLPTRLTAEQLAALDANTREAIDERLRVLENVQTTLQRCTDELLRPLAFGPRVNQKFVQSQMKDIP
ncbi:hypothetical protein BKA62DRAFT_752937 [Auriculariales sp. MPI-PUGE-AT-0066]|nr:hypothetical protein BKA62DRAFT_752937 [Auriculariales sp. MPI-PUGE-AT-0066]